MCSTDISLDVRIGELILLESMFPKQLACDDIEVQQSVNDQNYEYICVKPITCTFSVDKGLDINITLPSQYPQQSLKIHCRIFDGSLPNSAQKWLNDSITKEIDKNSGETIGCDMITIIQRVQELWRDLCDSDNNNNANDNLQTDSNDESNSDKTDHNTNDSDIEGVTERTNKSVVISDCSQSNGLSRYWIYSHHIKSTTKRKLIDELAELLHLNGFTHAGKPGFICIEGNRDSCESFWLQIRALNWQRITLIECEHNLKQQIFEQFEAINDNSAMFRCLEAKQCDQIIKRFLGFLTTNH